jgi:hypothetical protein
VEGGVERKTGAFGHRRRGRLVRRGRSFGSERIGLRPSYSRYGFGRDGVPVESL